jgi:hypothetical protein
MSQKEIAFFSATIRGEGRTVSCNIRVTKTIREGTPPVFSDYSVVSSDMTDGLPDGSYVVHLQSGEEIPVTRKNGSFIAKP